LQLAPGGHMGRFCLWSQAALEKLDSIFTKLPVAAMTNADIARIINSDEVQSVLKPAQPEQKSHLPKANAIRSMEALELLDPFAAEQRRSGALSKPRTKEEKVAARKAAKSFKKQGKEYYAKVSQQGDVCANGFTLD
jgi:large subunit ribosomal protein L4e